MMILFFLTLIPVLVYGFLLLIFRRGFQKLHRGFSSRVPTVSLIVPARNEEHNLPVLLQRLAEQTVPPSRLEIIFVNDRSKDRTAEIMNRFAENRENVKIVHIDETEISTSPKKQALARGIEIASGEIIVTTDADTLPGPNWIQSLITNYRPGVDVVLGYAPYRTDGPYRSLFHKFLALDYLSMGAVAAASVGLGTPSTSSGANLSYRKALFEKVGGFGQTARHHSGDDDLLIHRFRGEARAGFAYAIGTDAAVFTNPPLDFKAFFRQRVRFASKHLAYPKKMIGILSFVYGFYCLLLGTVIAAFWMPGLALWLGLLLVLKSVFEILFLWPAQRLLENRNLLKYYPLAIIPHIFYVVIFPILGQILPKRW